MSSLVVVCMHSWSHLPPLPLPSSPQLVEGLYQFKVTVTGDSGAVGEHSVNVTVLPGECVCVHACVGADTQLPWTLPVTKFLHMHTYVYITYCCMLNSDCMCVRTYVYVHLMDVVCLCCCTLKMCTLLCPASTCPSPCALAPCSPTPEQTSRNPFQHKSKCDHSTP